MIQNFTDTVDKTSKNQKPYEINQHGWIWCFTQDNINLENSRLPQLLVTQMRRKFWRDACKDKNLETLENRIKPKILLMIEKRKEGSHMEKKVYKDF